jgi:hypothetical protein
MQLVDSLITILIFFSENNLISKMFITGNLLSVVLRMII